MPKVKLFNEEEVLEKAMLIFWKKGYHATSIQDLVNFLGINRGSLYDTYGGKKQLFDKAFSLYRLSGNEKQKDILKTDANIKDTLRNMFQRVINFDYSDSDYKGCFIANTTTEMVPGDAELQKVLTQHRKTMEKFFHDLLKMGVKRQEISKEKDLKTLASLFYTLITGFRVVGKTRPSKKESFASIDAILSLLD